MIQNVPERDLREALEALETALTTPVVSGELEAWTRQVQKAWSEVSKQIHDHVTYFHPRQYQLICKQDSELLPQVEKLKAEDESIEQERESLGRIVERIVQHAPKFEPDEEKIAQHTTLLSNEGVSFVNRARKHEVAVETWFVEAFNRDRGVGD